MNNLFSEDKRDKTIDIMKGICIFSVVLAHVFNTSNFNNTILEQIRRFLCIYNLPVFLFCSGNTYKGYPFIKFLKKKIKTLYLPTIGYNLFSILLIPFWNIFGFNFKISRNIVKEMLFNNIKFIGNIDNLGFFNGTMWFMQVFLIAVILFFLFKKIERINKIIAFIIVVVGISFSTRFLLNNYWFHRIGLAFMMLPIMFVGNSINLKNIKIQYKYMYLFILVIIMMGTNYFTDLQIELSSSLLYGGVPFYLMVFLGIFFVFLIAKIIEKTKFAIKFCILSRYSFTIMALHCIVFKLIDVCYYSFTGKGQDLLYLFPYSYTNFRILYIILGTIVPVVIGILINKIKLRIRNFFKLRE
ncbi:acyltransferase family protein [Fusobacterium animalis]|uniref:acyltransferase family protein n=1 Tax=Fusobacterium TaxID=848 RepID=UPI0003B816E3|nr:acyltransferase family protein [Fusobacterium nucleatum]ERT32870.1 hypothetical protein HMPREF1766_01962 [Fusobacterium nucleatum CTI-5]